MLRHSTGPLYTNKVSGILPSSLAERLKGQGKLGPYWIMTADERVLKDAFSQVSSSIEEALIRLLEHSSIESCVDDYVSFDQIKKYGLEALWSLLWATGYLTFVEKPTLSALGQQTGFLKISNEEISYSYKLVFPKWVRAFDRLHYDSFLKNLVQGQVKAFVQDLRNYLLHVPSWFDFQRESDYHAFCLGVLSSLQETHDLISNREIGTGRPDLVLSPKQTHLQLGLVIEFKCEKMGQSTEHYQQLALDGLEQINSHHYDLVLKSKSHLKQILKLCMVFYGKDFVYKFMMEDIS